MLWFTPEWPGFSFLCFWLHLPEPGSSESSLEEEDTDMWETVSSHLMPSSCSSVGDNSVVALSSPLLNEE